MRTFEFRLFVNKEQSRRLSACLAESRAIYNGMLETVKTQYEQDGTFPSKYDWESGRTEKPPAMMLGELSRL